MKQKQGFVKGFTLIEILVAMGILGLTGGITTIILFTTLQGASKSDVLREVKQNGDYALSVMERMIRNASGINSACPGSSASLIITNPDSGITTFSLSGTPAQIASTGGMLTNSKVSTSSLNFNCTKPLNAPPVVQISFTLQQAGTATRPEEKAAINFQTTVSLRTY